MDQATVLFIGLAVGAARWEEFSEFFFFNNLLLASGSAFRIFFIEQRRFLCGPALGRQRDDREFPLQIIFGNRQMRPWSDVFPGLDALLVDMNLAAGNGFGGQFARFKKTCGPQPFIQADGSGFCCQLN